MSSLNPFPTKCEKKWICLQKFFLNYFVMKSCFSKVFLDTHMHTHPLPGCTVNPIFQSHTRKPALWWLLKQPWLIFWGIFIGFKYVSDMKCKICSKISCTRIKIKITNAWGQSYKYFWHKLHQNWCNLRWNSACWINFWCSL